MALFSRRLCFFVWGNAVFYFRFTGGNNHRLLRSYAHALGYGDNVWGYMWNLFLWQKIISLWCKNGVLPCFIA